MSAPELLPCPWCGPMNGHYGFTIGRFGTRLTCFCCDSHGPRAATREEAITAWNARADLVTPDPRTAALVEAARGIEWANEQLAATRTHAVYLAMIDSGQADALLSLDARRQALRAALEAWGA